MTSPLISELAAFEAQFQQVLISGDHFEPVKNRWKDLCSQLAGAATRNELSEETMRFAEQLSQRVLTTSMHIRELDAFGVEITSATQSRAREVLSKLGRSAHTPEALASTSRRRASVLPSSSGGIHKRRPKKPSLQSHRTPSSNPQPETILSQHSSAALHQLPYRTYFLDHFDNPYPSQDQKLALLAQIPGDTIQQCNNWFCNHRKRSGWTALSKKRAFKCKDGMVRLLRRIENGQATVEERIEVERVKTYFTDMDKIAVSETVLSIGLGGGKHVKGEESAVADVKEETQEKTVDPEPKVATQVTPPATPAKSTSLLAGFATPVKSSSSRTVSPAISDSGSIFSTPSRSSSSSFVRQTSVASSSHSLASSPSPHAYPSPQSIYDDASQLFSSPVTLTPSNIDTSSSIYRPSHSHSSSTSSSLGPTFSLPTPGYTPPPTDLFSQLSSFSFGTPSPSTNYGYSHAPPPPAVPHPYFETLSECQFTMPTTMLWNLTAPTPQQATFSFSRHDQGFEQQGAMGDVWDWSLGVSNETMVEDDGLGRRLTWG